MGTKVLLNENEFQITLERLAATVLERCRMERFALVGIQRRSFPLALRIGKLIGARTQQGVECGSLDISFYRDDWTTSNLSPRLNSTEIPFDVEGRDILLVDDVLYTGRTVRAALEALLDYGRPASIRLLALVDRGHRELPIYAEFVGREIATSATEKVDVFVREYDGREGVFLNQQ